MTEEQLDQMAQKLSRAAQKACARADEIAATRGTQNDEWRRAEAEAWAALDALDIAHREFTRAINA